MTSYARLLAGAVVALCFLSSPASAQNSKQKYCLNPASGGSSCSFDSMEQCWETMRGRNGWCSEQVDFGSWAARHEPENSFAYYDPGAAAPRNISPAEKQMLELRKKDFPAKGVGAE